MNADKILSFNAYVKQEHARAAAHYGLSLAEAERELPAVPVYWAAWRDYVVKSFDAGLDIPTRLWKNLDEGLRYRVLRSSRALRDDKLTHALRSKLA